MCALCFVISNFLDWFSTNRRCHKPSELEEFTNFEIGSQILWAMGCSQDQNEEEEGDGDGENLGRVRWVSVGVGGEVGVCEL